MASVPPDTANRIRSGLVQPYAVTRGWNYGPPDSYVCWTVFERPESGLGIAYCEGGFNLTHGKPWSLVWLSSQDGRMDMGDDSAWFSTLEDAFQDI